MTTSRPTLDTVAEAAGVSRMTVSNAYNRPDQLSAATRERVLAVAAELGYGGPDPAGRSLRRGRAGHRRRAPHREPHLRVHRPRARASSSAAWPTRCRPPGWRCSCSPPTPTATAPSSAARSSTRSSSARSGRTTRPCRPSAPGGSRSSRPGRPRLTGVPFVGIDNAQVGRARRRPPDRPRPPPARRRRAARGHADRAGRPVVRVRRGFAQRVTGFVGRAAEAARRARRTSRSSTPRPTAPRRASPRRASCSRARPRPTAIFAVSDVLALGVLVGGRRARHRRARRPVGRRLRRHRRGGAHAGRALTTVAQDLREQGRTAARMALAARRGGEGALRPADPARPGARAARPRRGARADGVGPFDGS